MGDIKKNISRSEMACECGCGFDVCDITLMNILQQTVDHFECIYNQKVTLKITGPNRCARHNEDVQERYYRGIGKIYTPYSSHSPHMLGKAADFKLFIGDNQLSAEAVYAYIDCVCQNTFGLGLYNNRCHVDVRSKMARWVG